MRPRELIRACIVLTISAVVAWPLPPTQDLKGVVVGNQGSPLGAAVCTLKGVGLPAEGIVVTTGERGEFDFPGLQRGQYTLTCAAEGHLPVSQTHIQVTAEAPTVLQVVLPKAEKFRQSIEVRESAAPVGVASTPPPEHVSSKQLSSLPLAQEQFMAALPLVPGVVRSPDGKINIKGSVENQGMLTMDGTEMVDPITGSYAIDVPLDAIESVDVSKAPYDTEYGHFSGGLTTVTTKAPSNNWDVQLYDLMPSFAFEAGHLSGVNGNSPRIRLTGPLYGSRLTIAESFTYFMHKQVVRGLPWPNDRTIQQGLNSFTNLQYVVSPQNLLTLNVHIFPNRQEYANIDSLVPQSASSNYGQRGFSLGANDRRLFASGALLSSTLQYTDFSSYGHGQGAADMQVTPDGWGGDFFNAYTRRAHQGEARVVYRFPRWLWHGKHEFKVGSDAIYRTFKGASRSAPVQIRREDGTLAEQIDFTAPGTLLAHDTEGGIFAQDHWEVGDRLGFDGGVRLSGQTLGKASAPAPRLGFQYAPGKDNRTVVRGGVGVFYSAVPLLAGSFTDNPTRLLTLFDAQGNPLGAPVAWQNVYGLRSNGELKVLPNGQDLDSTPYNVTWNLELDREVSSRVTIRLSYLTSRTFDLFVAGPQQLAGPNTFLLMTNTGGSRYREFESTVRVRAGKRADVNFSYVPSSAHGDLNTLGQEYVPFEQPIIRPNLFSALTSNVPQRVVTWGRLQVPWKITATPVLDIHSGFPYSPIDALQNYVGEPNSRQLPVFASLDLKLSKDFRIGFLPWLKNHTLRGALAVYNISDHLNPRDVYNNVTSPYFGHFAGPQHRFLEPLVDFVY